MDGLFIHNYISEIRPIIEGAMIQKIHHAANTLFIKLYGNAGTRWLILSMIPGKAHSALLPAMPLTPRKVPTAFCMGLRKHLEGGRIASISQPCFDRIIQLNITSVEYKSDDEKRTVVRYILESRLYGNRPESLLFKESGIPLQSSQGLEPDSIKPLADNEFGEATPPQLTDHAIGKRETNWLSNSSISLENPGMEELQKIATPSVLIEGETPVFLSLFAPSQDSEDLKSDTVIRKFKSASEASCFYSETLLKNTLIEQCRRDLLRFISDSKKRLKKNISARQNDLKKAGDPEVLRQTGDILAAALHTVKKGMSQIEVPDLYHGGVAEIKLNPAISASSNLEKIYNKAKKAGRAKVKISSLISEAEEKLLEFMEIEEELEILDISMEALEAAEKKARSLLKSRRNQKPVKHKLKPKASDKPKPDIEVYCVEGWVVMVGKNARANDKLTIKTAAPDDLFFHVADSPGGHVILRTEGKEPPEEIIERVASIAAWFSSVGEGGARVPVLVAKRRDVKKPPGAAPGAVTVGQGRSVRVVPTAP